MRKGKKVKLNLFDYQIDGQNNYKSFKNCKNL